MNLRPLPFASALLLLVACSDIDIADISSGGAGGGGQSDACPAKDPGFDPLFPEKNACGAPRACDYTTDPECPYIRTCAGKWSYEYWPAEGAACTKVDKVCVYPTAEDGSGTTVWTYCTADSTISIEVHLGYNTVCPVEEPAPGGPCPVSGKPCTYGTGCQTVSVLCDATEGWQVTPMPCP